MLRTLQEVKACKSTHLKQKMPRSEVVPFCIFMIISIFLHLTHFCCRKDIVYLFSSETLCIERLLCRIHGIMEKDRRCRVIKVKSLHLLFLDCTLELLRLVSFWILVTWRCTMCLPQEQWQWVAASRLYLGLSGVQFSGVTAIQDRLPDWVTASEKFVTCPYYIEILRDGRVESVFNSMSEMFRSWIDSQHYISLSFSSHLCLLQQMRQQFEYPCLETDLFNA